MVLLMLLGPGVLILAEAQDLSDADRAFIVLRDAARAGDPARTADAAARVAPDPAFDSYVDYYKLRVRIYDGAGLVRNDAPDDEIRAFLKRYDGEAIADRLRNDWLLSLAKRRDVATFEQQYPLFALKDDAQLACYAQSFRIPRIGTRGPDRAEHARLLAESKLLLREPRAWNEGCTALIEALVKAGLIDRAGLWDLVTLAYEQNVIASGRRVARWIDDVDFGALDQIPERGKLWLAKHKRGNKAWTGDEREIAQIALMRIAKNDPDSSIEEMTWVAPHLQPNERAYVWGQIGTAAAKRTMPLAMAAFREADRVAPNAELGDEPRQWQIRAALRAGDWGVVRRAYEAMSPTAQREPTWAYWMARGDLEGHRDTAARERLEPIADDFTFYGQLAAEELGRAFVVPVRPASPTDEEVAAIKSNAGLARALRFYAMGLRFEGNREWNWQLRGMSDRELIAVASYARDLAVWDRAVNTADRTRDQHDFALRFVTPFRDLLGRKAGEAGVDEAWVYGLIRQESRFILDARSGVGASGLMQLMPATAGYVAKRIGMTGYRAGGVNDLETNITLGTQYLRLVSDDLGGSPLLATAAYNAGPGRPRSWRSTLTRRVEGAVFAETIPFTETRDYVKKVLSNAVYYQALLGVGPGALKQRLGFVEPGTADTTALP
ncbi:lytic transglycosylase domain-containing protein [soil metagenome]